MRLSTEHLAAFIQLLQQDRAKLIDELVQDASIEPATIRGRIHQIDDIIRLYPARIKEQ
ncbi:MAG: hypothetical protein U5L02_06405 [Rheinheimera sp.]|nr:hypothetical protein [Rheinheimera sp.]